MKKAMIFPTLCFGCMFDFRRQAREPAFPQAFMLSLHAWKKKLSARWHCLPLTQRARRNLSKDLFGRSGKELALGERRVRFSGRRADGRPGSFLDQEWRRTSEWWYRWHAERAVNGSFCRR